MLYDSSDVKHPEHHVPRDRKEGGGRQGLGSQCALGAELQFGEMKSSGDGWG